MRPAVPAAEKTVPGKPLPKSLAGLTFVRGLVFFITDEGNQHPSVPGSPFFETLGTGSLLGIGNPVWIMLIVFAIGAWVLNRTAFGQTVADVLARAA